MNEQKSLLTYLVEALDQYRAARRRPAQEQAPPKRPGRLRAWLPSRGNILFTLLVVAGLLWATSAGALPLRAPMLAGDSTTTISYQGRLADSSGDPVTTSGVGMQFRLYNTDTGISSLWEEPHTAVPVEDGLFHVLLGSVNPIPVSLLSGNSTLWLGITVGSDSEMTPREQIASVPYAMVASTVADGAITTAKIADEAVTQAKLGSDVSLESLDGSIATAKIADGAVTSAKLEHSGPHIPITPDENGLVKMAVLRQDRTTDVYSNNQVVLTGWGAIQGDNTRRIGESITFGITFSTAPVVTVALVGRHTSPPSAITDLADSSRVLENSISIQSITTGGFEVTMDRPDSEDVLLVGSYYGYSWIAIGTLE